MWSVVGGLTTVIWSVVGCCSGRWSVFFTAIGWWSVVFQIGGQWFLWSVVGYVLGKWSVVGGRCHCGRWSVVCGRWLVGGRWFCTTPNDDDDEEARLRDRLKQLQIEKRACLRKKRIADLKRMVQEEERQLDDLKHRHDDAERENCQQHVRFATSSVSGHAVNSTKSVTTKTLKKLSNSMNFTPLDTLLGSAGTGNESVSQNSGMGLNLGGQCFQSFLQSSQSEHSVPVLGAAEGREKQSFLSCTDLPDQANILLQPKSSSNCKYYKVVGFVHSVVQHEKEKGLVEDGAAKLSVNYGYVKPKLAQIALQEYVIASIRQDRMVKLVI